MPRRGENIYKRKDGRWEGRYIKYRTAEKKACYGYIYGKTYNDVKMELMERQREIRISEEKMKAKELSFLDMTDLWKKSQKKSIKESTQMKYKNLLEQYILPFFGNYKTSQITNELFYSYMDELLTKSGKNKTGLSPKTVSDILSLMKNILRFASQKGYEINYSFGMFTVKQNYTQLRILTMTEQETLCKYLYSHLNLNNLGVLVSLFTGIRIGELCALKWEDISVTEKTIYIHQTMQRLQLEEDGNKRTRILISTPKSACSLRTIPIPESILRTIMQYHYPPETYFLTGKRTRFVEPRTMQYRFKKIVKDCGISSVNFHVLRHTFATRCVEVGFDTKSLSEILGHANVNITLNRYVHPSIHLKRDNMNKLDEFFAVK